jgi:hypothetical protein
MTFEARAVNTIQCSRPILLKNGFQQVKLIYVAVPAPYLPKSIRVYIFFHGVFFSPEFFLFNCITY